MQIPRLETERLILRGHRIEDFPHCAALWSDPVVIRYISGVPLTLEDAWSRLLRYSGHWTLLGFGCWVAEEKATGRFLGEVGFADLKRALEPSLGDTPEAGWVFATAAHGKGLASEAVRAIHVWGRSNFGTAQSACLIHPENTPSLRLAAKIGYRETARTVYKGQPVIVLHLDW
jgi:RimJ/RimL family protein N-acetyltransferase